MGDYSVATKNRFQLSMLDNSDDEDVDLFEILKQEEAKQEKKKPEEVVTKKNAKSRSDKNTKPKKVPQQQVQNNQVDDANTANIQKSGSANRTARGNDNKPPRMRQNDYRNKGEDFEKPPQDQQAFGGRGRARGGSAGFRGGRGGRGGSAGFRRYDRHSGSDKTGIKPTEKKEGSGGHNWGDEITAQLDSGEAADTQKSASAGEERTEGDGQADETINEENNEPAEPVEPEVVEMTLDEWKASQSGTRVKQKFNVRRAGEGEDQSQWKKTVALETRKRTESTEDESYEEEHDDNKLEGTRSALDKLNIEIRFATEESPRGGGGMGGRGGRGRGGRGGDRGGGFRGDRGGGPRNDRRGGRGGFRGGFRGNNRFSAGESAPRVDNVNEFPSLGSK